MAITTTSPKAVFNGNGSTDSFAFSFKVIESLDVKLYKRDTDGTITLIGSNYTVIPNANQNASPGGSVTFPNTGTKLQTGEKLILLRQTPEDQELDLTITGDFDAETFEDSLDKLTMLVQQLDEELDRTVKFPLDETPTDDDTDTFITRAEAAATAAAASAAAAAIALPFLSGLYSAQPATPLVPTAWYSTDRQTLEVYVPAASRWFLWG